MKQQYNQYTEEDHLVWSIMYQEQMQLLEKRATQTFLDGMQAIHFKPKLIPNFERVNNALKSMTGWEVYAVPGIIDNKPFFELLAQKKFPATTWMRSMQQLKYIEQPDMFHDVFGHVPLLSEPYFAGFLNGLSEIALAFIEHPTAVELMARVYWYTVEFGLIQENKELKIYGAGILSSPGETVYALSEAAKHFNFNLDSILETPYVKDTFQPQYFIADSYEQLYHHLPLLERRIRELVDLDISIKEGQAFKIKSLLTVVS